MRARLATASRSLRAADQPSDTWSSCIALVGSVSVLAGHGEAAVLGHHRRLRVLADHEAGVDAGVGGQERRQPLRPLGVEQAVGPPLAQGADVGDGDGEEVGHRRDRRAVEVAARLDAAVRQHDRVVDERAQLALGDRAGVLDRVAGGAVHLRGAAQRVGVLDPVVADPVAGDDRGAGEQPAQVRRAHRLADLRPHGDEVLGERAIGAEQRLGRHRPGQVGRRHQTVEVGQGEHEHPEHPVGAVDEGQALLGPQRHRRHAGGPHRRRAPEPAAVRPAGLALADEHQRSRGQRGEVAAGARASRARGRPA